MVNSLSCHELLFFSLLSLLRADTTAGLEAVDTQNLSFDNKLLIFTRDILFCVVIATNLELRLCCFLSSVAFASAFITILPFYSDPNSHLDNSMEMKMFMFASRVEVHVKSSSECFWELSENEEKVFSCACHFIASFYSFCCHPSSHSRHNLPNTFY